jgi:hypothetical protein
MEEQLSKEETLKKISDLLKDPVIKYGQEYQKENFKSYPNNKAANARSLFRQYLVDLSSDEKDKIGDLSVSFYKDYLYKFLGNSNTEKVSKKLLEGVKVVFEKYNTARKNLTQEEKEKFKEIDISMVDEAIAMYPKPSSQKNSIKERKVRKDGLGSQLHKSLKLFFNENSCPTFLKGSWYFFERVGIENPFKQENINHQDNKYWGVTISELTFGKAESYFLPVTFKRKYYNQDVVEFEGIATKDKANVYIDLINDNDRLQIVLRLADKNRDKQNIFVGHFTFFSPDFRNRTISKIILMVDKNTRFKNGNSKEILLQNIELGKMPYISDAFNEFPKEIRDFLSGREQMRIYTPALSIYNQKSLGEFLKNHQEGNVNETIKNKFAKDENNEYFVYYQRSHNTLIQQDEFSIKFSPYYNALEVTYLHNEKRWYGKPYINTDRKCIILELSKNEPKVKQNITDENPILLTFQLPKDDKVDWNETEIFPAVISGLEDWDEKTNKPSGISILCLVVRKSVNHNGKEDNRIKKIFADNQENARVKLEERHLKFSLDEI